MKKTVVLLIFIVSLLGFSCRFESEGVFTDDTTEEYQLYDYYIDSYGNEGIVAYIHSSKISDRKYMIVISSDESFFKSPTIATRKAQPNNAYENIYTVTWGINHGLCNAGART